MDVADAYADQHELGLYGLADDSEDEREAIVDEAFFDVMMSGVANGPVYFERPCSSCLGCASGQCSECESTMSLFGANIPDEESGNLVYENCPSCEEHASGICRECEAADISYGGSFRPMMVEDDEYNSIYQDLLQHHVGKGETARIQQQAKFESAFDSITSIGSCTAVCTAPCTNCYIDCALRSRISPAYVQETRKKIHNRSSASGVMCRYVARMLSAHKTEKPTRMHEEDPHRRKDGSLFPNSRLHYVLNGWDVCQDYYQVATGLSSNMLSQAFAQARSGDAMSQT
jgi:hypothetical protein